MKWLLICLVVSVNAVGQSPREIVINEILFNPSKDGFDYLEIYNRSETSFDLSKLQVAKRSVTGDLSGMTDLSRSSTFLLPQHYAVVTGNEKWLRQQYRVGDSAVICQVASMPSFPDDEGSVIIMSDTDSNILDELHYDESWHFALIADRSGVALERINMNAPTQDRNNWVSAASSAGFGTPGSINSHAHISSGQTDAMTVEPAIFSPDNDGVTDLAMIRFNTAQQGYVANLMIYDMAGRRVRYLLKNETLGASAEYIWNGLGDNAQPLPQGVYFLGAELFNLNDKTKRYRTMITLARRQ